MINKDVYNIFKQGSTTYFYSSWFFPQKIKEDVFSLYAFVRKADDFVDSIPQKIDEFDQFEQEYYDVLDGKKTKDVVIGSFVELMQRKGFKEKSITYFLNSMRSDTIKNTYRSFTELNKYMHGSAQVIGLLMAKILDLDKRSYKYAKLLGRSMQYINFIRDIMEDTSMNRLYIPKNEIGKYGFEDLKYETITQDESNFIRLIRRQVKNYRKFQKLSEKGFKFIPKRFLIPIKTASDMYKWTAEEIYKNPLIIFKRKVKPSIQRIIASVVYNNLFAKGS